MSNLQSALRLTAIPGMGTRRILNIYQHFRDFDRIFNAGIAELCQVPGIDLELARSIKSSDTTALVENQLSNLAKSPFKAITVFDSDYPAKLKNIYDPPIILYYLGNYAENDTDAIAIVGTRTPSNYGKSVTETLVRELVAQDLTIVSGFARGIDTIAHKTAINSEGRTIAVLGNGLDYVYPAENRALKNRVIEHGFYCTEFDFGTKPDAVNFPRRNRIISGLSLGTVVIEAGEKSGAILTAYYSIDQNREVFALPGRLNDSKSIGTNRLIQKGAKLVLSADDILDEIEKGRKYSVRTKQLEMEFKLTGNEKRIYEALSAEPVNVDTLVQKSGLSSFEILPILLNLELKGHIRQLAGKMFIRA